jgi:hypothetical protein
MLAGFTWPESRRQMTRLALFVHAVQSPEEVKRPSRNCVTGRQLSSKTAREGFRKTNNATPDIQKRKGGSIETAFMSLLGNANAIEVEWLSSATA